MLSQYRMWTRSRYRNTNNRYQSVNVTASLPRQRHTDMSVTGVRVAATRRRKVKREKRGHSAAIGIRTTATNPQT